VKSYVIILFLFLTSCAAYNWGTNEVNLVEHYDLHFVNIKINGIPGKLLVDTGASKSLLDISKSEEYGFQYLLLAKSQYVGLGGETDIYVIYDYKIEGPWVTFLGADLADIQEYFSRDNINIVGILGVDFLETNNCRLDFTKNKLYIK
jgi:hypothetical protein